MVRETTDCVYPRQGLRFQSAALEALQDAAEAYLIDLFSDVNRCALHAGRVTVKPNDFNLVLAIRRERVGRS